MILCPTDVKIKCDYVATFTMSLTKAHLIYHLIFSLGGGNRPFFWGGGGGGGVGRDISVSHPPV